MTEYGTSRSSGIPTGGGGGGGPSWSSALNFAQTMSNSFAGQAIPLTEDQIQQGIQQTGATREQVIAMNGMLSNASALGWGQVAAGIYSTDSAAANAARTSAATLSAAQIGAGATRAAAERQAGVQREVAERQAGVQREATAARAAADAAALAENSRQFNLNIEEQRRQFAEKMGFDQKKFEELTRQFDLTTAEGKRQFNERLAFDQGKLVIDQQQFNDQMNLGRANAILQAPRGPADYFAYAARLPALQQGGYLGDFLSKAIEASTGQKIGQLAAQPVVTNTQLATGLVGAGAGRPMDPAVAQYLSRSLGVGGQAMGQPQTQVMPGSVQPLGTAQPVGQATGFQSSAQEFGRLDPTLQKLYLSLQSEGVPGKVAPGQTPEDFLSGLVRAAPNFARSQVARLG